MLTYLGILILVACIVYMSIGLRRATYPRFSPIARVR